MGLHRLSNYIDAEKIIISVVPTILYLCNKIPHYNITTPPCSNEFNTVMHHTSGIYVTHAKHVFESFALNLGWGTKMF